MKAAFPWHATSEAPRHPQKLMKSNIPVHSRRTVCFAFAMASAFVAVASGSRASTNAPSSSPTPTIAPYIEQPQVPVTTYTSVPTYSPSYGSSYSGSSYYGYGGGFNTYSTTYFPRRYFFPPTPPALGEAYIRNRTKSASLIRSSIPISLSEYVNEPFYSPLSPFLYEESLSKKRQKTLDDYQAAKLALITELRATLESVSTLPPSEREAKLAEFASLQTPRVAAVEKLAYDFRDDLTEWHLFASTSDWNEGRDWRLGDDTRWESTLDEAKVMRGAAFFQDGLSPAQRRLLREYAMELDDSGRGPTADMALDARGPFFYFSPETSRIRLPANLPPELEAKIVEYRQLKVTIKKELRDVLYHEDRRWLDSRRTAALKALAAQQAPQIAALDPLAEEIRRGLAGLPNPARPPAPSQSLPAPLAERLTNYMAERASLQRTLTDKLLEIRRQFPGSRVEFVKNNDTFIVQVVGNRKMNDEDRTRLTKIQDDLGQFNADQAKRFTALGREKEGIRAALVQATGPVSSIVTPKVIDLILREYSVVLQQQELWNQYRDYETAVLQPGLSPEQRRLLYDAALVKLDQQLPFYTY